MWPKLAHKARARPAKSMATILTRRLVTESLRPVLVAVGRGFGLSAGSPPDPLPVGPPVSVQAAPQVPAASHMGIHMFQASSDATVISSSEHVFQTQVVLIPWASVFVQIQMAGSLQICSSQQPHQIEVAGEQKRTLQRRDRRRHDRQNISGHIRGTPLTALRQLRRVRRGQ